jgi:cytochrome P450
MVLSVLDLLSAGTETTATTIQWAVLSLVNHPEVQENIRIEFTENTSEDCPPQLSEKSHFSYCEVRDSTAHWIVVAVVSVPALSKSKTTYLRLSSAKE